MFRHTLREKSGFTLMEMITVIVIISIIFTVGLPLMNRLVTGSKLKVTAQQISNTLSLARQTAISKRRKARVYFGERSYWIAGTDDNGDTYVIGKVKYLANNIEFDQVSSPDQFYEFKPNGGMRMPRNFQINDISPNGKLRIFRLNMVTGRIRVTEE
jgi:prepilin-type N-terminal cleavage/methylation domain-containing protein